MVSNNPYKTYDELKQDCELVCTNAKKYNQNGSLIWNKAKALQVSDSASNGKTGSKVKGWGGGGVSRMPLGEWNWNNRKRMLISEEQSPNLV